VIFAPDLRKVLKIGEISLLAWGRGSEIRLSTEQKQIIIQINLLAKGQLQIQIQKNSREKDCGKEMQIF
jgi:hypothetical protein